MLLLVRGSDHRHPAPLFTGAARRLPLSTLGFLQYIAPSLQLLLGVFLYREPFPLWRIVGFGFICPGWRCSSPTACARRTGGRREHFGRNGGRRAASRALPWPRQTLRQRRRRRRARPRGPLRRVFRHARANGAGKTTTIEILEGLNAPDAGEVLVLGERWHGDGLALRAPAGHPAPGDEVPDKLKVGETLALFRSSIRAA